MKQSVADFKHTELQSKSTGEKYSLSAVISDVFGFQDVFVHHEIIPPGRRSSASHTHSQREEMIYVLSGSPTAHLRGESCELKPGDFIGFAHGDRNFHYVENKSNEEVRLLVVASNPKGDEVVYE